jgi:acetyl-CoA carboxylase biotin carboxyl carrier protein
LDLKEIKLIVDLMKKSDLTEFEIEQKDLKLKIKRSADSQNSGEGGSGATHPPFYAVSAPAPVAALPASAPATSAPTAPQEEPGITYIKSPMVGTFYRSPSPESPPFVDNGAKVQENTVVCIIEAMKIMNEIQAELKGTVVEVLVENGQPVEFGQKLFKVKAG